VKKTTRAKARNVVGTRVRKARLRSVPPISQEDLAGKMAALGVLLDRSAISRIESSERYVMDYEIVAFSKALKVSVASLFGEER
jgi:transcriptional regulator with XRE-family HTH domain